MHLLTATNPKINKGSKFGYMSFVLHLAPADLSGRNVCPKSSAGCRAACLNLAGRGGLFAPGTNTNKVQAARIRRTNLFFNSRDVFMELLAADIQAGISLAKQNSMVPAFRLNGTSDLSWEKYPVTIMGVEYANIFAAFPGAQFYDYGKVPHRNISHISNYHLTFSAAEDNHADVAQAIAAGYNIAMVFDLKKNETLPETWDGLPVIDGDVSDLRFTDPRGVIVGLRSKGQSKLRELARSSGFARRVIPIVA